MSGTSPMREVMIEDVLELACFIAHSCAQAVFCVDGRIEKDMLIAQARMMNAFLAGARRIVEMSMVPQADHPRQMAIMDVAIDAVRRSMGKT